MEYNNLKDRVSWLIFNPCLIFLNILVIVGSIIIGLKIANDILSVVLISIFLITLPSSLILIIWLINLSTAYNDDLQNHRVLERNNRNDHNNRIQKDLDDKRKEEIKLELV